MTSRRSGVLVPLFSLRSTWSWGVGEFADLPRFARWLRDAGQSSVQILPITEIPEGETSPYSAMTAMALDPVYIALADVPEFRALGGEAALSTAHAAALARVRGATRVQHTHVRALKDACLRRCHEHFVQHDLATSSVRAGEYREFTRANAGWLDDYALFRALRTHERLRPWWDWPTRLAHAEPAAVADARTEHAAEVDYRCYVQWIAATQWREARKAARPLQVFGDVPFMLSADSPDVWVRQQEFRFDATVGVPPDAFSETGQDWGLPPWRWEVMAENGFAWMRQRAAHTAALFDGFRLDHLVGLYRTYVRPRDGKTPAFFAPADEKTQILLGEHLIGLYRDTGADVIAEDLGTVPDFVRASLTRRGVPGFKVMRWERQWNAPGRPYVDPAEYPALSVATTGTHDTETLAAWWADLPSTERTEVLQLPSVRRHAGDPALDAMLRALLASAACLTILPLQDIFGWHERINVPGMVSEENWSWLVPWPIDEWSAHPEARARARLLHHWTRDSGRDAERTAGDID